MAASSIIKEDLLKLASSTAVEKMLAKIGKPLPKPEEIFFSGKVVKINRRNKEQNRILIVTDKAIYNVLPKDNSHCQRRIALDKISVTTSTSLEEFVLHVPSQYDYRFKTNLKDRIIAILSHVFRKKTGKKLLIAVVTVSTPDLKAHTITKVMAREMTIEQRQKRQEMAASDVHESDNEDDEQAINETSAILETAEKVTMVNFDILKVIGRGSFGKVMMVRKKTGADAGKVYALKILRKPNVIARNQVEHTKSERNILQGLQHPFLMSLRYAFQTKAKLYFVLDFYGGGELFYHLKIRKRFSEDEARLFAAEIALALGYLHSKDIIYRDLKPENILLDADGHVCLTDFGLSKDLINPEDKAHTFCGTPEYLAPEVVMGCGHNKEVDWWSLGTLLYELTVGMPPFYSQNVNEMYVKIQHGVLKFPPFLSKPCRDLIVLMLNRDPSRRLGSGVRDVEDIKLQPFFANLDWDKVHSKGYRPLYKPTVKNETDTSNFEKQFTDEPAVDSLVEAKSKYMSPEDDKFAGFTFAPTASHLT